MKTSAADNRWHQIPSPTARIARLENTILDLYTKISELHKAIGQLRITQDEMAEHIKTLEEYAYNT